MTRDMLSEYASDLTIFETECFKSDGEKTTAPTLKSLVRLQSFKTSDTSHLPESFQSQHFNKRSETLDMRAAELHGYSGQVEKGVSFKAKDDFQATGGLAEVIVINDAGNELRHSAKNETNLFHGIFASNDTCDVIMKMHMPLAKGLAWESFSVTPQESKTLILHADDLRLAEVPLSRCPSWDAVVSDFVSAIDAKNTTLGEISAAHAVVVVLFGVEAALIWNCSDKSRPLVLVCDPMRAEGQVSRDLPGDSIGIMNRFLATFVHAKCIGSLDLFGQVETALLAARLYSEKGFEVTPATEKIVYPRPGQLLDEHNERLAKAKPHHDLPVHVSIKIPKWHPVDLLDLHLRNSGDGAGDVYLKAARGVVKNGVEATLSTCPHGRFGKLWTVDREEIESLRAVDRLISNYLDDLSVNIPVSIAVFGPPGSGKSFGVKQLVDPKNNPIREYNISQARAEQLPAFFHEIRDLNLEGKTPLCFFDEFDSQELALLKSFLAPMQDGKFLDGDVLRPIGRGIFVFAGGTSNSMAAFEASCERPAPKARDYERLLKRHERAKSQKLPDFVSRLHLHLNVKGPNAVSKDTKTIKTVPFKKRAQQDPAYILRRAILLRRFIERFAGSVISEQDKSASIEEGLLDVLLRVHDYRHGARSLELLIKAIVQNSDHRSLGRSDLPGDEQIASFITPLKSFQGLLKPRRTGTAPSPRRRKG